MPGRLVIGAAVISAVIAVGLNLPKLVSPTCSVDATASETLTAGIEEAAWKGCQQATLIYHRPDGTVTTVKTIISSPETATALAKIAAGSRQMRRELKIPDWRVVPELLEP